MKTANFVLADTTPSYITDLESAVSQGYSWGEEAATFFVACLLAASLVAWFLHRS